MVRVLPNLDYKIVCGDALLGNNTIATKNYLFTTIVKLKSLYFSETDPKKKQEYKQQIDNLITNGHAEFDFEVYFSEVFHEKGGFDVVIANPPYVTFKGKQKIDVPDGYVRLLLKLYPNSAEYKVNSFALFVEKGTHLFKTKGILTYIIPGTFLQNEYLKRIRKYVLSSFHLTELVTFGNKVFEAVTDSIIVFIKNENDQKSKTVVKRKNDLTFSLNDNKVVWNQAEWNVGTDATINPKVSIDEKALLCKVDKDSQTINDFLDVYVGIVAHGIKNFLSDKKINERYKKYLQGKHIKKYQIAPIDLFVDFNIRKLHSNTDESVYLKDEKILVRKTGNVLIAAYDNEQFYTDQSIYNLYSKRSNNLNLKYLLSLLNSKLMNFYFNKKMITNPDVYPYIKGIHLKKLPVKQIPLDKQSSFITHVDHILAITKDDDYLQNPQKQAKVKALEREIDRMVYQLYGLTDNEIQIVEEHYEQCTQ